MGFLGLHLEFFRPVTVALLWFFFGGCFFFRHRFGACGVVGVQHSRGGPGGWCMVSDRSIIITTCFFFLFFLYYYYTATAIAATTITLHSVA